MTGVHCACVTPLSKGVVTGSGDRVIGLVASGSVQGDRGFLCCSCCSSFRSSMTLTSGQALKERQGQDPSVPSSPGATRVSIPRSCDPLLSSSCMGTESLLGVFKRAAAPAPAVGPRNVISRRWLPGANVLARERAGERSHRRAAPATELAVWQQRDPTSVRQPATDPTSPRPRQTNYRQLATPNEKGLTCTSPAR